MVFETFTDRICFYTGYNNWLTIELFDKEGNPQAYEIFFTVTKQSKKMLRIFVESAYIRDVPPGQEYKPISYKRRDRVRAKVLLAKKLRGEALHKPRH